MGLTKTENFSTKQNEMAQTMKALAHPARIAILEILVGRKSCVCGELVDVLPLSQSTISQHLKELKKSEIIKLLKQAEISGFIRGIVGSKLIEGYDKSDDQEIDWQEFKTAVDKINIE